MILRDSWSALCELVFNIIAETAQPSLGFSNAIVPGYTGSFTQGYPATPITRLALAAPTEVPSSRNVMALQRTWSINSTWSCFVAALSAQWSTCSQKRMVLTSVMVLQWVNSEERKLDRKWKSEELVYCFAWQGFGSRKGIGVASLRSCQLSLCLTQPMPAGSKVDPPLAKAKTISV